MIQGFAYFPTIIYRDEHPEWVDYTCKITKKYFDKQENLSSLFQTEHIGNDIDIKFLIDYLISTSINVLNDQGYMLNCYDLYISGLWGQEIKPHGETNIHLHKNSQLCGWFFLETPEKGSYPIYYDTRMNKQMVELDYVENETVTNATSSIHFNNIIPGTILISNSWMQHKMSINMSDNITKALHFIISHKDKLCSTC